MHITFCELLILTISNQRVLRTLEEASLTSLGIVIQRKEMGNLIDPRDYSVNICIICH